VIAARILTTNMTLRKVAVNLDIRIPDNVIGEKRNRVVTELKLGKGVLHFHRAENGDPGAGQRPDHPVERLAKVARKPGRERPTCDAKTEASDQQTAR